MMKRTSKKTCCRLSRVCNFFQLIHFDIESQSCAKTWPMMQELVCSFQKSASNIFIIVISFLVMPDS